jgi:hypothetical protein
MAFVIVADSGLNPLQDDATAPTVEQARAIVGHWSSAGSFALNSSFSKPVKPDFNCGMGFFVLNGRLLPDLEKLGNRIGVTTVSAKADPDRGFKGTSLSELRI